MIKKALFKFEKDFLLLEIYSLVFQNLCSFCFSLSDVVFKM